MSEPKRPTANPAQRWDLGDHLYAIQEFPAALRQELFRSVLGTGVLDGFRIHVVDQVGFNVGHLNIFNGYGTDWQGQFLNARTGINSERLILPAPSREYWIELELLFVPTDPDARAFWDALVDNPDPFPDGKEVQVPNVFTRLTPFWRVKQPILSNPVGLRTDALYAPTGFSPSNTFVVPIAVVRTNASRQILAGDPSVESDKNDIVSVTTALGTRQFIKVAGYGEPTGSTNVNGRITSDQRPRIFERLQPLFGYGAANEVRGEARTDHWVRDWKSAYDHMATAIMEIKEGASLTAQDLGDFNNGTIQAFAVDFTYVDLKQVLNTNGAPLASINPNQFINCTFQVTSGNWAGFYARISGNDRTDGGGVTRVYLQHLSSLPDWKDLPGVDPTCRIVQHRQRNWLAVPTPSTSNRGLNALDTEVFDARTDGHITRQFNTLRGRLDGNKQAYFTLQPGDVALLTPGGRPADFVIDPGEVLPLATMALINSKLTESATPIEGGVVHFRKGSYNFNNHQSGGSAFVLDGVRSFTFQGEGMERTILNLTAGVLINNVFKLTNCRNIVFRDLSIRGIGQLLEFAGVCGNITFERCSIYSTFASLATPTVNFGDTSRVLFDGCQIRCSGTGLDWIVLGDKTVFRNTQFLTNDLGSSTKCKYLILVQSSARQLFIHDCTFEGQMSDGGNAIQLDDLQDGGIHHNVFQINVSGAVPGGSMVHLGDVVERVSFSYNQVEPFLTSTLTVPRGVTMGSVVNSNFCGNRFRLMQRGLVSTNVPVRCVVDGNTLEGPGAVSGAAIDFPAGVRNVISDNAISNYLVGVNIERSTRCTVSGNEIEGVGKSNAGAIGINCDSRSAETKICVISGNYIEKVETGIFGEGVGFLAAQDQLLECLFSGNTVNDSQTAFLLRFAHDCGLTGNRAVNPTVRGFDFRGARNCNPVGNRVNGVNPSNGAYDMTDAIQVKGGFIKDLLDVSTGTTDAPANITQIVLAKAVDVSAALGAAFVNDGNDDNIVAAYNEWHDGQSP